MVEIDYLFEITRFTLGFIGTLTYFMCLKHEFLNFGLDDPKKNSNAILNNMTALGFFLYNRGLGSNTYGYKVTFWLFFSGVYTAGNLIVLL